MPILNFSYAKIKDSGKFNEYIKAAAVLMEEANVEVIVRGEYISTKRGEKCTPHIAAVFRYPDKATAEKFYASEEYKVLIPLRDEACDMTVNFYEES